MGKVKPDTRPGLEKNILVGAFMKAASVSGNAEKSMNSFALKVLENFLSSKGGLKKYYNSESLVNYFRTMKKRKNLPGHENPVFVHLEPEDFLAVGNSFGPNIFADKDGQLLEEYRRPGRLSLRNRLRLHFLNASLGIKDEDSLPTLGEALAARGMTKAGFLVKSREAGKKPPEPPSPLASGPNPL